MKQEPVLILEGFGSYLRSSLIWPLDPSPKKVLSCLSSNLSIAEPAHNEAWKYDLLYAKAYLLQLVTVSNF